MSGRSSLRPRVFAAAAAFYLFGVAVAVLTGVPSAMAASTVFVAATGWALGARAGAAAFVAELAVAFVLFGTGVIATDVPAVAVLVPAAVTDALVLTATAALRRAEARQAAAEARLRAQNDELAAALAEVKELRGMLPICAWCKCVRDVDGMWNRLEAYLSKHSHATLTHGICPACVSRMGAEARELVPGA